MFVNIGPYDYPDEVGTDKERTIDIRIDYYDTWSMDHTLALIVLPMLKQLRETKHGSQIVDLEDVPELWRFTTTEDYDSQTTFDFYNDPELCKQNIECDIHDRWNWVLDEMIWAFEQITTDWEPQFYTEHSADYEGRYYHQKRIDNGLRLFGKYYQGLWD